MQEDEKKEIENFIGQTALLAALDSAARTTVIGAVEKQDAKKGDNIIKQVCSNITESQPFICKWCSPLCVLRSDLDFGECKGDDGDYFYILHSGAADVFIKKGVYYSYHVRDLKVVLLGLNQYAQATAR